MVENEMSSQEVADLLGITINNLRQIQHRGTLKWQRREWRNVFYSTEEVLVYAAKREARKHR
jgi:predicted site-specific integrase-resolvase